MGLTLELPPPLEEELSREARREELSPAEHATLLLCVATAFNKDARATPFRAAVKAFLSSRAVDADRFASALEALLGECSKHPTLAPNEPKSARPVEAAAGPAAEAGVLQSWRTALVHTSPADATTPSPARPRRQSARGKCAYLGLSSEEHAREKQEDLAREEEGWE